MEQLSDSDCRDGEKVRVRSHPPKNGASRAFRRGSESTRVRDDHARSTPRGSERSLGGRGSPLRRVSVAMEPVPISGQSPLCASPDPWRPCLLSAGVGWCSAIPGVVLGSRRKRRAAGSSSWRRTHRFLTRVGGDPGRPEWTTPAAVFSVSVITGWFGSAPFWVLVWDAVGITWAAFHVNRHFGHFHRCRWPVPASVGRHERPSRRDCGRGRRRRVRRWNCGR